MGAQLTPDAEEGHARQGGGIPPAFMVGAIGLVQAALAQLFRTELSDPHDALEATVAWNKLLNRRGSRWALSGPAQHPAPGVPAPLTAGRQP